ncbi:energy-coupling factor transporter transmembrane component T [Actinopolymorpha pittospori]|uniref:Energy-coupling factor transport system permease protein n=1 Tax=Actinopolymorpha pittospori TaxID=648752 RepID=A0A927N263_9ACTN|nr:energy-coupling factor transporter transmembrane component T [Actinopolymorpha pittospori]MBE1610946.1 energy-coupling factor transport system permease protein [Actinopolymorpha pittospori]
MRSVHRPTLPRNLHPGAWWLWALGLATAASRTTNPLLLVLVLAVAGYVVTARRSSAPWARSYTAFLKLGLVVIAIRVVFQCLFGAAVTGRVVLFTIPQVPLPGWMEGIRLGGAVTAEALASSAYDGLRLATVLACVGAANALANPKRLLATMPGALYELGVAVVVAMTFAPQLVTDATRIRSARRLRGQVDRGPRMLRSTAVPLLEGALERSLALAAAMDSRGYGRLGTVSRRTRLVTGILVIGGLVGVCAGTYGLLDASGGPLFGLPVLVAGALAAVAGLALGGRRAIRTKYRPDPWALPEWLVAASGAAVAAAFVWSASTGVDGLVVPTVPLGVPTLPLLPAGGVLVALLPAWLAPPPPRSVPSPATEVLA